MISPSLLKIYNASAGSGKTYTLVKEYLLIILRSNDYSNFSRILAITFTNKAASEMKDRIIETLKEFASKDSNDWETDLFREFCISLELDSIQLNERAQKTLSQILHQYSNFSVSTIDKFTHRLVRNFSQDLGLPSNFEVEMDADKLLNESVELLLSKLGENPTVTKSLINYSLSKLDDDKSWNISLDLANAAKILLKEDSAGYIKQLKNHSIEDFGQLKKQLTTFQKEVEEQLKTFHSTFFLLIQQNGIKKEAFSYKDLPNYIQKLLVSDLSKIQIGPRLQKQLDSRILYKKTEDSDQTSKIDAVFPQIELLLKEITDYLNEKKSAYLLHQLILRNISSLTVINEIEKELTNLKDENNILLNAEFNKIISEEIKNQPAPYIYERIGEKYQHYFIDEFQDTSVLQWQNLKPLVENQLAQSGNALIVGDSKQSIYRWRGGDPEQFINLSETGEYLPFQTENLKTNYRSFKNIIDFNNTFYQTSSNSFENNNYKKLYEETTLQKTTDKENGFVELFFTEKTRTTDFDQIQLDYVMRTVHDLLEEEFAFEEITILVRNNKHGILIAQHLISHNIPIISKESLLLKNAPEIQLTEKILQIIHVENDYKTRAELLIQLHQNQLLDINEDLHSFIHKIVKLPITLFFEKLEIGGISFNLKIAKTKSLYDLVEYCYRQFHLIQESKNGYIQYFLDFIIAYTSRNQNDLNDFLTYWNDKKEKESIVTPDESNAVQIMTIHKSKGLQFPVVILPYLDWEAFSDRNAHIWIPLDKKEYGDFDHFYISANQKLAENEGLGKDLITQNNDQVQLDNLNILYVATTRAVERLYISTLHQKETKKASIAYYFNNYLDGLSIPKSEQFLYQIGSKNRTVILKKQQPLLPIQFHSNEWQSILEISKTAPKFWDTNKVSAIEYGNMIHSILAQIQYKKDVNPVLNNLLSTGYIPNKDFDFIKKKIYKIIETESLHYYFSEEYIIFNERDMYFENKILRPDRVVIKDKHAIILDYKTGEPDLKYISQLNLYAAALQSMGYIVDKKLLVYIHDNVTVIEA